MNIFKKAKGVATTMQLRNQLLDAYRSGDTTKANELHKRLNEQIRKKQKKK